MENRLKKKALDLAREAIQFKYYSNRTGENCIHPPINQKLYRYKTVDVIFADESDKIVVITVKVYYHN